MDSTPPYNRSRAKSSSRLARIGDLDRDIEGAVHSSLDFVPSPKITNSPSPLSLKSPTSLQLQELSLLSPSPVRKSKNRFADRLEMGEDINALEPVGLRRRCKNRGNPMGILGCASPRNHRRSRRRSEVEINREDKDMGFADDMGKPRKKRHSGRSKKEKLSLVPAASAPCSISSPKTDNEDGASLDHIGQQMTDLIMWKDVSKSTLWFGFGSLCFLSSFFAKGLNFSIFSAISQLALICLGASFFSNTICQRNNLERKNQIKIGEDDMLRLAKVILPASIFVISKTRELFSGEPSMTLKVAPFLLLGAEYGHLITLWRLCAIGFFFSFTIPKLYSSYFVQISQRAEQLKSWLWETWGACSHKKLVAASAVTAFWNLTTMKTRIFIAFLSLVVIKYYRQHAKQEIEERGGGELKEEQQALVVAEPVYKN